MDTQAPRTRPLVLQMIVPGGIRLRAGAYSKRRHDDVDAFPGYAEGRAQMAPKHGGSWAVFVLGLALTSLGLEQCADPEKDQRALLTTWKTNGIPEKLRKFSDTTDCAAVLSRWGGASPRGGRDLLLYSLLFFFKFHTLFYHKVHTLAK